MCVFWCVCVGGGGGGGGACVRACVRVCFFWEGRGGTTLSHGHKESYTDFNLKNSTSEWDSNPRPHEY